MLPYIIIIVINILGYFFKSFGSDRYLIFLGFRFHLATTLPVVVLLFNKRAFNIAKEYLKQFNFQRGFYTIFVLFITVAVFPFVLYLMGLCKYTDPEYLYELGVSSLVDYPIYLLWNLPQLLIFISFLFIASYGKKLKFLIVFSISVLSFAYEFIPFNGSGVVYSNIYLLVSASLLLSLCTLRLNIYVCSIVIFTILWGQILVFGNFSNVLLKTLLAKNYIIWEGVLLPDKTIGSFVMAAQFGIAIILFLPTLLLNSNKQIKNITDVPASKVQVKTNIE